MTAPGVPVHAPAITFHHQHHPRAEARKKEGPAKVADVQPLGFNGHVAVLLTNAVGTMICAYVFAFLAVLGFPGLTVTLSGISYSSAGVTGQNYVQWISQTFIQLVMLSIIMVGQNILGAAADKRSTQTYQDAEAILHEAEQIQDHLKVQDDALNGMLDKLAKLQAAIVKTP
jgi:hypothetical protein